MEQFQFYIDAFTELHTTRPSAFGIAPISFSEIWNYYTIYNVWEHESFEDFKYVVRIMDNKYLTLESAKEKAKNAKQNKSPAVSSMPKRLGKK